MDIIEPEITGDPDTTTTCPVAPEVLDVLRQVVSQQWAMSSAESAVLFQHIDYLTEELEKAREQRDTYRDHFNFAIAHLPNKGRFVTGPTTGTTGGGVGGGSAVGSSGTVVGGGGGGGAGFGR